MRKEFAAELLKYAKENSEIILLTGDLGYHVWDDFRDQLPHQFINVGASEQCLLDISIGLALAGKRPFCYSITPFLIYRPFEAIHLYLNHEGINVKLIGSGVPGSYAHEGYTHNSDDIDGFLQLLPNIEHFEPENETELPTLIKHLLESDKPAFVGLSR